MVQLYHKWLGKNFDQKNQGQKAIPKAIPKATRPISLRPLAGYDFSETEYRYIKGYLPKFWWATACNRLLFQNLPKSLHKIEFFPSLRPFFSSLKVLHTKMVDSSSVYLVLWTIIAFKLNFQPQNPNRCSPALCALHWCWASFSKKKSYPLNVKSHHNA